MIQTINGHFVEVPHDMFSDDGNHGPGSYDCVVYKGVEITTFDLDDMKEPEVYTGPFMLLWDDNLEEVSTLDEARATIDKKVQAHNIDIHQALLALGYVPTHYEATYEDVGTGETGPILTGGPAFDEYLADDHHIIIDHNGNFAAYERVEPLWDDDQYEAQQTHHKL